MGRNDDPDTMCVSFLGRRPLDLADHSRLAHVADIQNDYALIAIGEISAVFVGRNVVERNPYLGQSFTQSPVGLDPVLTRLFSAGSPLPRKPPACHLFRVGG